LEVCSSIRKDGEVVERALIMAFIPLPCSRSSTPFNIRSRNRSLFEIGIFTNKYLIGAIIISVTLLYLVAVKFLFCLQKAKC
jgi:magnesium-transporting ATPase (P-type)